MAQRLICTVVLLACLVATDLRGGTKMADARHALDSLTAREIATAIDAVKGAPQFVAGSLFAVVALDEPPKQQILSGAGAPAQRKAFVVLLDRDHNRTNEVIVNLAAGSIASWKEIEGVQPSVVIEEYVIVPEIVKADPRLREAMRRRGITDLENVKVDAWAPGHLGDLADGSRIVRALFFYKENSDSNWYSRPIEGVVAIVNLTRRTVIDVIDTGVVPISADRGAFDEKGAGRSRIAPKPLRIVQPQGPSFEVTGHDVAWQKWRFHFGLDPREGLVLHRVRYVDRGRERSILYRASLSEMVVPYGDPDPNWAWRSAFDVGEYGIGRLASPTVKGTDVPENAVMFDFPVATDAGGVQNLRDAVALYERDGGMMWKHYDIDRDYNESRRARQLVLSFITTVGNYDYALNWIFHQDGTLEFRADLTGIMLTKGVQERLASHHGEADHAHYVAPNLVAPHHQHFFNFRLDLDVDGTRNSIRESNTFAVEEPEGNPLGNAFVMKATPLASEQQAQRDLSFATQRKWKVISSTAVNELGEPTSYMLAPGDNSLAYLQAAAPVRKRAHFLQHQFWATKFRDGEIHASGYYPNQSKGGDGLERWTSDDESLAEEDVVLWYTTGVTHVPRPEEWPIMSVHQTGFKLLPAGFFSRNPSLDIPKEK
jgi:primary-amine oxidase